MRTSRAFRWAVGVGLGVVAALSLVLLFMLAQATGNRELYERYYAVLFTLNVALASLLLAVIVWLVLRMAVRLRQGKFGSRLLVKLAAIFALVGLLPGVMIYGVSYQFVNRSIGILPEFGGERFQHARHFCKFYFAFPSCFAFFPFHKRGPHFKAHRIVSHSLARRVPAMSAMVRQCAQWAINLNPRAMPERHYG